jgi:hypothetical protein
MRERKRFNLPALPDAMQALFNIRKIVVLANSDYISHDLNHVQFVGVYFIVSDRDVGGTNSPMFKNPYACSYATTCVQIVSNNAALDNYTFGSTSRPPRSNCVVDKYAFWNPFFIKPIGIPLAPKVLCDL